MPSYVNLGGVDGAHINTPDKAAFDIASMVLTHDIAPTNWNAVQYLSSRWGSAGNQVFLFYLDAGGILTFVRTQDGTNALTVPATAGVGFAANQRATVRVIYDPASGVTFQSALPGQGFVQVGTPIALGATLIFANSNSPIDIGRNNAGTGLGNYFNGKVYGMSMSTLAGSVVLSPSFTGMTVGQTTVGDGQSNVWTLQGAASVVQAAGGAKRAVMIPGYSFGYNALAA